MSRATAAKSRAEKGGKSGLGNAPTPAITHEIVTGKFNDHEWNLMVDRDDGDDFLHGIVEEICSSAMDTIYQNYLQKQVIPYTVMQAKDAMLQIIEWQFLAHDEGENEIETDPNWLEDEEPECAVTDCWAQGSVPKNTYPLTPRELTIEPLEEEPEPQQETKAQHEADEIRNESGEEADVSEQQGIADAAEEQSSIVIEESEIDDPQPEAQPEPPKAEVSKKKKKTFKPHYGPLGNANTDNMTESLEQREIEMLYAELPTPPPPKTPETAIFHMPNSCHSIIKLQAGRPPGTRDVVYDHAGNVVSMTKLNPEKLPNHRVRTGFQVVDPQTEAAQARLEAMRTGRHLKTKRPVPPATSKPVNSKGEDSRTTGRRRTVVNNTAVRSSKEDLAQLPPPLIDSMEVSPGVVVREGDRIKRGPKQQSSKSDFVSMANRNLRPVVVHGGAHMFSVQDLLGDQQPVIRPLESPPIPPIRSHPPAQKAL